MPSESQLRNLRYGQKVARNSMYILIALTLVKAFGGYISNAVSLLGDAASSFSDMVGMVGIYIGLTLSLQPPSKRFRYGYHRVETFITLLISGATTYFGYKIFQESLGRLVSGEHAQGTELAIVGIIAAVFSIAVSIFTWKYQKRIAVRINSQALLASSNDKRNDAFVTAGVLAGLISNAAGIPVVEQGVAVAISLIVFFTGLKGVKDALLYLFDYWDDPAIAKRIKKVIQGSKIVTGIKKIRLRHAGTFIFGEAFLKINPFTDINDLRDEIHHLDWEVKKRIPHLGDFAIYVDPPKPQKLIAALPVKRPNGMDSELETDETKSFHFLIVEIENRKVMRFEVSPETFHFAEAAPITKFLKEKKVNVLITNQLKTLLYYPLRLANIRVSPPFINVKDANHTVKLLLLDYF